MPNLWQWVPVIDGLIHPESLLRLQGFERLLIGFSGGLDSTVLLHVLANQPELSKKLTVIHIHHGLSGNADTWVRHCQDICQSHGLPLIVRKVSVDSSANVEEAARKARYEVFLSLIADNDCLLLAHHRDDQAETLLLQLFRGAGLDGLSAMAETRNIAGATLMRPLLHCSRKSLEAYAHAHQLTWVDDESNTDSGYSRNFLRHQIIPLLQQRWPGVLVNLARTASHCFDAQLQLAELATLDYPESDEPVNTLSLARLGELSYLRINNILRNWLKKNSVRLPDTATFNRLIPEVIFASPDANPELVWDKYCIRRHQQTLYLLTVTKDISGMVIKWRAFPQPLALPGGFLLAKPAEQGLAISPGSNIEIRFRQGGESIVLRKQTKSLKKLFQEWSLPVWQRERVPLLYVDGQLAAVIGYAVSDNFYQASGSSKAYEIVLLGSLSD